MAGVRMDQESWSQAIDQGYPLIVGNRQFSARAKSHNRMQFGAQFVNYVCTWDDTLACIQSIKEST